MKDEIRETIKEIGSYSQDNDETMDQFIQILDLPDEQFKKTYPQFKNMISNVFESSKFQQDMLNNLRTSPKEDIEKDKEAFQSFFDVVDKDDSMIDEKKELLHIIFGTTLDILEELSKTGREHVKVKVKKLDEKAVIPTYAHPDDAGADVYALEDISIPGGVTKIIDTGLAVSVPKGYMLNLYPRSGVSVKTPLRVANSIGVIDSNYRGSVGVIMHNTSNEPYNIKAGDRIAQMILMPIPKIQWDEVDELDDTDRGEGGFGSTDKE